MRTLTTSARAHRAGSCKGKALSAIAQRRMTWMRALQVIAISACLAWASTSAHASDCDMRLSEDTVDYGHLNRSELGALDAPGRDVSLGKRKLILTISCRQAAEIALRFNAVSAAEGYVFTEKGSYTVLLMNATLDGHAVALAKTQRSGRAVLGAATSQYLEPGHGVAAVAGRAWAQGTRFVAEVEIEARIPHSALRVSGETQLIGLGQMQLLSP